MWALARILTSLRCKATWGDEQRSKFAPLSAQEVTAAHGIHRIVGALNHNGTNYRAAVFVRSVSSRAARHQRTKSNAPSHNRKIEGYQRILAEELLYARKWTSEEEWVRAIEASNVRYDYHRPHTATGNVSGLTRPLGHGVDHLSERTRSHAGRGDRNGGAHDTRPATYPRARAGLQASTSGPVGLLLVMVEEAAGSAGESWRSSDRSEPHMSGPPVAGFPRTDRRRSKAPALVKEQGPSLTARAVGYLRIG